MSINLFLKYASPRNCPHQKNTPSLRCSSHFPLARVAQVHALKAQCPSTGDTLLYSNVPKSSLKKQQHEHPSQWLWPLLGWFLLRQKKHVRGTSRDIPWKPQNGKTDWIQQGMMSYDFDSWFFGGQGKISKLFQQRDSANQILIKKALVKSGVTPYGEKIQYPEHFGFGVAI